MPKLIQYLFFLLAFFLPLQTLWAQYTSQVLRTGILLSLWKELIMGIIIGYCWINIYLVGKNLGIKKLLIKVLPLITTGILSAYITFISYQSVPLQNYIAGFRFELIWVWFFATVVSWIQIRNNDTESNRRKEFAHTFIIFRKQMMKCIIVGFIPVAIISMMSLMLGQATVLARFGYGGESKQEFITASPLVHVVDGGWQNMPRLSGTFSTPNHFAGYLVFVFAVLLLGLKGADSLGNSKLVIWLVFLLILNVLFLILSFARYSWLGIGFGICIVAIHYLVEQGKLRFSLAKVLVATSLIIPLFIGIVLINLPESILTQLPSFLSKPSSSTFHYRRMKASIDVLIQSPEKIITGFGLGSSGPAAKREYSDFYNNPLIKNYTPIIYENFGVEDDLVIPENWYIQLVMNGGIVYAIIYMMLTLFPLFMWVRHVLTLKDNWRITLLGIPFFVIFIGNFFLHVWENQTIALYWTLLWIIFTNQLSKETES